MSTYILVHGSWHGAWCWYKIIPRLRTAGHKVVALDMPGHSRDWRPPGRITMQDFVDTITRALDQRGSLPFS
jgi:pimeloyl-ACP methyl ester carboxylesterase